MIFGINVTGDTSRLLKFIIPRAVRQSEVWGIFEISLVVFMQNNSIKFGQRKRQKFIPLKNLFNFYCHV